MPKTSLAAPAPVPRRSDVTTEPTAVLEKRVHSRGLCTVLRFSADDDPWYPTPEGGEKGAAAARQACLGCRVKDSCLELALRQEGALGNVHGVRGGLAPDEREALIRARRKAVRS